MGKKILNTFLFLIVLAAAIGMTLYVGQGAKSVLIYNFAFLAVMVAAYLIGLFGGMFRMNRLSMSISDAANELENIFKVPGRIDSAQVSSLNGIFNHAYLDGRMQTFTDSVAKSSEGICDIEDYLNEDELDTHIHKRLLEMAPDLFTSLGILGTFVGLVWGLKNFEPTNYEAMTSSVSSLVDGIKVAFLTSIYGIGFSIVYTYGMKGEYSGLSGSLQRFLDIFHARVMPSVEAESMNLMLSSQKNQAEAMGQLANELSTQMAEKFEKVLNPTFEKMSGTLDNLSSSMTLYQEEMVKGILDVFLKEMNASFQTQFADFGAALTELKEAQTNTANYTNKLYKTMSRQFAESFMQHEQAMTKLMQESQSAQKEFMEAASRIVMENQEIQNKQQEDYQHIADYLKEAEKSSAKFWVACNQTMQNYVETASKCMQGIRAVSKEGNVDILYSDGQEDSLKELKELLEEQGRQQKELLEELNENIRSLSKNQKTRFSLFK